MNSDATNDEVIAGLLSFLQEQSIEQQLDFWQTFREKHRSKIASGTAVLCPALLRAVDAQIESLHALIEGGGRG